MPRAWATQTGGLAIPTAAIRTAGVSLEG